MSSNWPVVTIDDIKAEGKGSIAIGPFGSRMKSDCYVDKGIPVIRGTNITGGPSFKGDFVYITKEKADSLGSSNVYKNDLVFPHRGSIGEVGIILEDKRYVLSSSLMKLTCDLNKVNPVFLYYFFKSRIGRHELLKNASQVGTPGIGQPLTSLKGIEFRLPPLNKQNEIGNILSSLDKKIEVNTQTNQTLEQIAKAIFRSWFVDFDPVKAKIETLAAGGSADDAELAAMRVISAKTLDELNGLKASNSEAFNKLAQTAALFPGAMQDSELGEIPEGWNVEQLGDHLSVLQTGNRPKGGVGGITEGVPSVGAENILGVGNYTYGKEKFVSREFFDKLKRGVVEDFDFLLYKDGGKPGEFKPRVSMFGCGFPYSEFAINEHVFRMRSESLGQAFLYFQIGHKRVLDELANRGGKAAIPGINQTDVKTIPVLVPGDADLLTEFNDFAQKIIESILKKSKESNHLVAVRDTLLPKLLSGEIDLTSEVVA